MTIRMNVDSKMEAFFLTVAEEVKRHCLTDQENHHYEATGQVDSQVCKYITKKGRIVKVLTYKGPEYYTVIVLSSAEGLHPSTLDDRTRLMALIANVNDWIPYGSLLFTADTEEVCYKTAQIFTEVNSVRTTLAFMMEQHERCFEVITSSVKALFDDVTSEPKRLSGELQHVFGEPS